MSDVEKMYAAICKQWTHTTTVPWHELPPMKQMMFMQALNTLIQVMHVEG